jgi:hypothetical protein
VNLASTTAKFRIARTAAWARCRLSESEKVGAYLGVVPGWAVNELGCELAEVGEPLTRDAVRLHAIALAGEKEK